MVFHLLKLFAYCESQI